jgi:predicted nucleic acid-binding protein
MRTGNRRGRTPTQLAKDAEACLERLRVGHTTMTSSLTCYEVEEAVYSELKRSSPSVAHVRKFIIPAARAGIIQTLMTIELFGIRMVELTSAMITEQCRNIELQKRGIRAADSLHITTALQNECDLLVTADDDLLAIDNLLLSPNGKTLRCVDTDVALSLIP